MNETKNTFRINIVDILITLVIIAGLTVGALMLINAFDVNAASDDICDIEYTIQFKRIRNDFKGLVNIGDDAVDAQKRHNLGKVIGVEEPNYTVELYKVDTDTRISVDYPHFCNIEVTVVAKGYQKDGMWYLKDSGKEVGIGTPLYIHFPSFCGSGYISDMTIIK